MGLRIDDPDARVGDHRPQAHAVVREGPGDGVEVAVLSRKDFDLVKPGRAGGSNAIFDPLTGLVEHILKVD
ncbi:MAG TPA: hypothetical protein VJQ77_08170 [Novosphingobium sp.]|nr:hypothetical protein [Novosphingobium sp.]